MNSKYSFEKKEKYLLMSITGKYTRDEFMLFANIILERCEKEKVKKVLVNALNVADGNVATMDRFYMGENFAKVLGPEIRLTVVWPKQHITKFAEDVAVNRGLKLFVTHSLKAAEDWLLND